MLIGHFTIWSYLGMLHIFLFDIFPFQICASKVIFEPTGHSKTRTDLMCVVMYKILWRCYVRECACYMTARCWIYIPASPTRYREQPGDLGPWASIPTLWFMCLKRINYLANIFWATVFANKCFPVWVGFYFSHSLCWTRPTQLTYNQRFWLDLRPLGSLSRMKI